jgi:hypothetical protein
MLKYGIFLLGCAGLLSAGTIDVYSIQPATSAGYQSDQYGHYIGPYQLNTSIGELQVMCIDLFYGVNPPYTANLTPITEIPTSPQTTYLADQTTYMEEAYLYTLIVNAPNLTIQGEIQDAAWALDYTSFRNQLTSDSAGGNAQAAASLAYLSSALSYVSGTLDLSLYDVISNTAGPGSDTQEFIYHDPPSNNPPSQTPEPAALGLVGGSLVGLGLLFRRGKRGGLQGTTAPTHRS